MKNTKKIIIVDNEVYEKVNNNERWVIPNSKKSVSKNEKEVTLDGIGRIQLAKSIMDKMGFKAGDKIEEYQSGRNIIIKKLNPSKSTTRETSTIIDNKYEIKVQINTLDFNTNHKIMTLDELGRVLIWYDIRKSVGIIENDTLKVCPKESEDMIILVPKKRK